MRIWPRSAFRVGAWGALHPGSGIRPFRAGAGARPRVVPSPAPAPQYGRLRRPASSPSPSRRSTAGARGVARPAAAAVRDPTPGRRLPPEAVREVGAVTAAAGGVRRPLRPLLPDRCVRLPARARRVWRAPAIGPRRPTGDRRHRDVRRLLAAGPAPSPASPPQPRRHPIGCTYTRSGVRPTDIYALARDTPGRRSRDTPSTEPVGPATPPVRSNVVRAHLRRERGVACRPADAGPGPRRPRALGRWAARPPAEAPSPGRRPGRTARARRTAAATDNRPRASRGQRRRRTGLAATTRPSDEKIAAWRRMYLEHHKDPDEPRRCAAVGCHSRFPCGRRLEAAELLIVAGVGVPSRE